MVFMVPQELRPATSSVGSKSLMGRDIGKRAGERADALGSPAKRRHGSAPVRLSSTHQSRRERTRKFRTGLFHRGRF
ncbi:hypothetical protein HAHE_43160 [Haloferula helveola]|uniref:Uncharacterized protein n=1 Tax=Haloferula helveola TaxID=490095 RepID=A0ABM7RK15_9BACT|nr:hypothetical protein HAHE_43160 [Haloferula helveola]